MSHVTRLMIFLLAATLAGCSGGDDPAPGADAGTTDGEAAKACGSYATDWDALLLEARACTDDSECTEQNTNAFICGCPTWVATDKSADWLRLQEEYTDAGCATGPGCRPGCRGLETGTCDEGLCSP